MDAKSRRCYIATRIIPICFLCGTAAFGQSFEVASVKAAGAPADGRLRSSMRGGPGTSDPGQILYVALMSVILPGYNVKAFQVGGPEWLGSLRFDIAARIPPGTTK